LKLLYYLLCQVSQNIASVLFAFFIRQYSSVIKNFTSVPCLYSYSHTVGLHADIGQCCLLLNSYTFPGWVPVSLYHNVTWMFSWSLVNHKYDLCSDETWMLNSQGSLSYSLGMCVCRDWTATDGTHNCMPSFETILAVTANGWSLCVDFVYVVSEAEILMYGGF